VRGGEAIGCAKVSGTVRTFVSVYKHDGQQARLASRTRARAAGPILFRRGYHIPCETPLAGTPPGVLIDRAPGPRRAYAGGGASAVPVEVWVGLGSAQ